MIPDRPVFFNLSPPAVYGENWGGNPLIFLEKLAREPHSNLIFAALFAFYFGKLHKGTPHYTRRGDQSSESRKTRICTAPLSCICKASAPSGQNEDLGKEGCFHALGDLLSSVRVL